jgi:hypothetical protein
VWEQKNEKGAHVDEVPDTIDANIGRMRFIPVCGKFSWPRDRL